MTDSGEDLLDRVRRGDPEAFEEFVRLHGDRIFAFGMRVCGNREGAEEVAQETLIQAYRSLGTLRDPAAVRSWLYRVASNACMMRRRKAAGGVHEVPLEALMPGPERVGGAEPPDFRPLPDEEASRGELREAVRRAIAGLPEHYRVVLVLRDMEELSTRETADVLELPESTIKMRLHRARLMVRERLERGLEERCAGRGA